MSKLGVISHTNMLCDFFLPYTICPQSHLLSISLCCYKYNAVIKQAYSSGTMNSYMWVPKVCLPFPGLIENWFNTRAVVVHAWFKCQVKVVFLCSCWCDSSLFLIWYLNILCYATDPTEDNSFNLAYQRLFNYNELVTLRSVYIHIMSYIEILFWNIVIIAFKWWYWPSLYCSNDMFVGYS